MAYIFPSDFMTAANSSDIPDRQILPIGGVIATYHQAVPSLPILVALIIATIIGNLMVIVAILLVPKLRRPRTY
ncbi:hypothetical protein BV898_11175 [Hypsibius exemplaris]|uniref:Uncharacterized protein n=1 Tax=Hypsibius exemplaris TaxID=2072580 RepID=A0A1W0WHK6_HYPEX|nr:hypothetical protein BV898_11175 [Hypsibius exemplaris]